MLRSSVGLAHDLACGTSGVQWGDGVIQRGVSANLCAALAGLVEKTEATAVALSVQWAPARLEADAPVSAVEITRPQAGVLRELARVVRERAPVDDVDLVGAVVQLAAEDATLPNVPKEVAIACVEDGRVRKVRVGL